VFIGIGIDFVAAVLSASVLAAMRGDAQISGRGGLGSALIVLVIFGLLGFGIYRFRFRPRTEASEMDASSLRLRHSSKDRFGRRTSFCHRSAGHSGGATCWWRSTSARAGR
jgi:hypothetical protein